MPEKSPLRIKAVFGPSRDQSLLLTAHPEESHDKFGKPVPNRRTLVLALKGTVATFREEHPAPLVRAWYSPGSGVAYCTSVATNKLYKWQSGKWSEEVFTDAPVKIVRFIFGLPGTKPEEDQVFLAAADAVFIRTNGTWKRHRVKNETPPYQIHGRKPDEVFIGGDPLRKWNGKSLEEVASPDDGEIIKAVWVTDDDRLIGGGRSLYTTDEEGAWHALEVPLANLGHLEELGGVVYCASDGGLVQAKPPQAGFVTAPVNLPFLANVGDGLIAFGDETALVGDGKTWKEIQVPSCELGKRPG
jgi:hypothetical protein